MVPLLCQLGWLLPWLGMTRRALLVCRVVCLFDDVKQGVAITCPFRFSAFSLSAPNTCTETPGEC